MTIQVPSVLFSLSGGGDHYQFFASPEALEWVYAHHNPDSHHIPDDVKASLAPFLYSGKDPDYLRQVADALNHPHELSTGSAENDKALVLDRVCQH